MNSKKAFIGLVLFLSLSFFGGACEENLALVAAGYNAKVICSSVFVSGRDQADIEKNDLLYTKAIPVKTRVDREKKEVIAVAGGVNKQRAVYRDGLGCTLVIGVTDEQLAAQAAAAPAPAAPLPADAMWPQGEKVDLENVPPEIDKAKLGKALDFAFTDPSPAKRIGTRAMVVVYQGQLVAERYASGFSADMPLIGWSMTKSVTSALVGVLVRQGKLDVHSRAPVPEWSDPADPRSAITLEDLLRMSSGLKWEDVSLDTEILRMMFLEPDTGAFAASMPLAFPPGTHWAYSTGATNIISRIVR